MKKQSQLPIPVDVQEDSDAAEILRVWIAHEKQYVSLMASVWDDPAAWGIMLADIARHVARAYQQDTETDYLTNLLRVKAGFDMEMESPTS